MANQYFVLMENDHYQPKNKLEKEIRERAREDFNQILIDDPKDIVRAIDSLADQCNQIHSRCKPIKGYFYDANDYIMHPYYIISGIFTLRFYEVNESNVSRLTSKV